MFKLRSSFIAVIFIFIISGIAISFSVNTKLSSKLIESELNISELFYSDLEFLEYFEKYLKDKSDLNKLNYSEYDILIEDISSLININFVDFTLFKDNPFRQLLAPGKSWIDLENFRNEIGYTTDIYLYSIFFQKDIELDKYFTIYNYPNLNNSSDLAIEKYYGLITNNENKAENLKIYIQNARKNNHKLDEQEYKNLKNIYGLKKITISPNWNINKIPQELLKLILTKYNIGYENIINLRKNRRITNKELPSLLGINETNKTVLTYLGDLTTFYKIEVTNSKTLSATTIIIKYNFELEKYKIISIVRSEK